MAILEVGRKEDIYNTIIRDSNIIHFSTEKPWTSLHNLCKKYFFHCIRNDSMVGLETYSLEKILVEIEAMNSYV